MDSITQAVLGAAVGEAVAGRQAGRKAALWGAALGTLPDLDVFVAPFVSEAQALAIHRSATHSLFFSFVAAPLVGFLIARLHRKAGISWQRWSVLAFFAFVTHLAIDAFTTYGTQVFWPFSDYPVSIGSIFIIDPLYTVPLAIGLAIALWLPRTPRRRRIANYAGLAVSTLYLLVTFVNKQVAESAFKDALARADIPAERLLTTPMPLNSILWSGMALHEDTLYVGLYSLFDGNRSIAFERIPRHSDLLMIYQGDPVLERLFWFSRGYYTVSEQEGALIFHDVRFGRADLWLGGDGLYAFSFELLPEPGNPERLQDFRQQYVSFEIDRSLLERYKRRLLGNEGPQSQEIYPAVLH